MHAFHQKHMNFNSQPHKEADDLEASVFCPACDISTHSLTRRLTFSDFSSFLSTQFQLTASQGG